VPDRQHHPPGHQRGDRGQQHDDGQGHADQNALHQQQGGLLLGEREDVVQLVETAERDADGQGGHRVARVVDQRGRLVGRGDGVLVDVLLALLLVLHLGDQRLRDRGGDVDVALADPVDDGGIDVGQLDEDQVAAGGPAGLL
jgi:hypothetical protein